MWNLLSECAKASWLLLFCANKRFWSFIQRKPNVPYNEVRFAFANAEAMSSTAGPF